MRLFILFCLITIASVAHAAPLTTGLTDDTHPVLEYVGTWSSGTYVDAYGGMYQVTSDPTATVTFETFAEGVTIFFIYDGMGDDVEVCVNVDCLTVSTVGSVAPGRIELTDLAEGVQTVSIRKVTNDSSVFLFDAIYVHPSDDREVTQQITEFEFDGQVYSGTLDLRITSGDAILALLLAVIALLMIFDHINGLWK